jgi:hypothetical protein
VSHPAGSAAARQVAAERYPGARAVFLAGSAARGDAAAGSDLDLLVVGPDGGPVLRETLAGPGEPYAHAELFVHTEASWRDFVERETALRRSPLLHMCAEGVLVVDDGLGGRMQAEARRRWEAGPAPLSAAEREDLRYALTDLIDDLGSVADPGELLAVGARVLVAAGELALLSRRHWIGTGKWLVRRWARASPQECAVAVDGLRALAATGDPRQLVVAASAVLDAAGGRCADGYRREAPATSPATGAPTP